jgi:hypothetical protein
VWDNGVIIAFFFSLELLFDNDFYGNNLCFFKGRAKSKNHNQHVNSSKRLNGHGSTLLENSNAIVVNKIDLECFFLGFIIINILIINKGTKIKDNCYWAVFIMNRRSHGHT